MKLCISSIYVVQRSYVTGLLLPRASARSLQIPARYHGYPFIYDCQFDQLNSMYPALSSRVHFLIQT